MTNCSYNYYYSHYYYSHYYYSHYYYSHYYYPHYYYSHYYYLYYYYYCYYYNGDKLQSHDSGHRKGCHPQADTTTRARPMCQLIRTWNTWSARDR